MKLNPFSRRKVSYRPELVDNDIILSVRHLKQFFVFGHGHRKFKTKAVHNISFDVKKGECFGLVGESGCGKTTTGRSLIRLYDITSGSIYFKGYRISAGKRWNQKEIKYTRIHLKENLEMLKAEESDLIDEIYDITGKGKEIKKISLQLDEVNRSFKNEKVRHKSALKRIRESVDDENDQVDLTIKENTEYETKLMTLRQQIFELKGQLMVLTMEKKNGEVGAVVKTPENLANEKAIKEQYILKAKQLKENARKVIAEQKEAIKQIRFDNRHVDRELMSKMQMIFQDPVDSLDPRMTVEDIIQEGLRIQGHHNHYRNSRKIAEVLEKVGLIPEYASRYPHEFSGGQRQRIGIARALIMNPEFLICDEPISALDVSIRAQIINLLNNLKEEMGLTMLFIAHDLSVVKYFCDRIAVMYYGEIVELTTSDELFRHPLHPYTNALLSAIPKPDPLTEKTRQRIVYNPYLSHDYSKEKPSLTEIIPGHWVLANSIELAEYKKRIMDIDKARVSRKNY